MQQAYLLSVVAQTSIIEENEEDRTPRKIQTWMA
jgi:hypothetical protein